MIGKMRANMFLTGTKIKKKQKQLKRVQLEQVRGEISVIEETDVIRRKRRIENQNQREKRLNLKRSHPRQNQAKSRKKMIKIKKRVAQKNQNNLR